MHETMVRAYQAYLLYYITVVVVVVVVISCMRLFREFPEFRDFYNKFFFITMFSFSYLGNLASFQGFFWHVTNFIDNKARLRKLVKLYVQQDCVYGRTNNIKVFTALSQ